MKGENVADVFESTLSWNCAKKVCVQSEDRRVFIFPCLVKCWLMETETESVYFWNQLKESFRKGSLLSA